MQYQTIISINHAFTLDAQFTRKEGVDCLVGHPWFTDIQSAMSHCSPLQDCWGARTLPRLEYLPRGDLAGICYEEQYTVAVPFNASQSFWVYAKNIILGNYFYFAHF